MSNEHEERNIVEKLQSQGIINSHRQKKEKCILVLEDHVHNVKPLKTITGVMYRMLRRVA